MVRVKLSLCFLLSGSLFLCACSSDADNGALRSDVIFNESSLKSESVEYTDEQQDFDDFLNETFLSDVTANTLNLHYTIKYPEEYGITDYPVTLGDISLDTIEDTSEVYEYSEMLNSFDYDSLTKDQQLTYDILMAENEITMSGIEISPYYIEPLSPNLGDQSNLPILLAEYEFNTEQDIQDYLVLLTTADEYFESLIDFEKQKASKGLFMSDKICDQVIDQCRTFIKNPESCYLIDVFNSKVDDADFLTEAHRDILKMQNEAAVIDEFVPSYNILIDGLTELRGSGVNDGGLCNFQDGTEYYEYLVAENTGSLRTVEEIDKILDKTINTCYSDMSKIYTFDSQVFDKMEGFTFDMSDPEEMLEDLKSKMTADFPAMSDTTYTLKYVNESLEKYLSPAFYIVPAIDDVDNNSIYLNSGSITDSAYLYTILGHEGYPGHLYQNAYTAQTNPHPIRSLLAFYGYAEGWATYAEMYAYDYMCSENTLAEALKSNQIITLCMYAKADIGIHYYNWDIDALTEFIISYGFDESYAEDMYWYIVSEPANYLRYTVGYLEFEILLDKCQEELGDKFVLKDFHDCILRIGPAPFSVVEKYIDEWIAGVD